MNNAPIEDRKLLYRDLCARKPYGVKVQLMYATSFGDTDSMFLPQSLTNYKLDIMEVWAEGSNLSRLFKPYLFPLSSMTEEQRAEICKITYGSVSIDQNFFYDLDNCSKIYTQYIVDIIVWLKVNHFDYLGLIPKGLAIDATGKNIY